MWNTDDGRFLHFRVSLQHLLDLLGENTDAATLDDVFLSPDHVEVAVFVEIAEIAG